MADVYRNSSAAFVEIVGTLSADQLAASVPACPAWTVHDLLAHQAGSSTDLVRGDVDGVASTPWTARQVADRRGRGVRELTDEWSANVETVAALCARPGPSPAWDVTVHLDDLREAVGIVPHPADEARAAVLDAALALLAQDRGVTAPVTVSLAERGPDPGTTTWHTATAYGTWRALFSRADRRTLQREVVRGDVDAFARTAFFYAG